MSLFVDTSIWYSAANRNDLDHSSAARIVASGESLITTDHVVVESWRLISHRIGRRSAESFVRAFLDGAAEIEIVGGTEISKWLGILAENIPIRISPS